MEVSPHLTFSSNTKKIILKERRAAKAFILLLFGLCIGCVAVPEGYEGIPPGEWRGVLKLENAEFDASSDRSKAVSNYTELPFNFHVTNTTDSLYVTFRNGKENIKVSSIDIGLDRSTAKDTIVITFDEYDTYLKGIIEENIMEGQWVVNYKEGYSIPFIAYHGQDHRFINHNPTDILNFAGRWDVTFDYDKPNDAYKAIGVFQQKGNQLEGTFLTETGDYRFLEGDVLGEKMKLSVFDGSHAFYFESKNINDTLFGVFRSGKHYSSNWQAVKKDDIELTSPFELTTAANHSVDWDKLLFKDLTGKSTPIINTASKNTKLINIMGSWCPNCKDEVKYLQSLLKEKAYQDIEMYSVCYERYKEEEKNLAAISRYKQALDIQWPLRYGGRASKQKSSEDFPFLSNILSYPTLLVLDSNNKIRSIHTGFNGPATPDFENFDTKFRAILNDLTNE